MVYIVDGMVLSHEERLCNSTRGQVSFGMPALPFFLWGPPLSFFRAGTPRPLSRAGVPRSPLLRARHPAPPRSRGARGGEVRLIVTWAHVVSNRYLDID